MTARGEPPSLEERRRQGLTRMPSRISMSSLNRSRSSLGSMADAAAQALKETADVEVDDKAFVISPIDIDVTHAVLSNARSLEMQTVLTGTALTGGATQETAKQRLYVTLDLRRRMYVTLVVKQQNRKKHNSNRLFFDVFSQLCSRVNFTRYYFCTDAGTLYSPHTLCTLLGHMEANPDCGACCGHQHIMHYRDQQDPDQTMEGARESWGLWALRSLQGADCNQGLVTFNGLHSRLGFLPVIPGPCGLFRASQVTHDVLDQVNLVCASPNSMDDVLTANLRLAEDRVISYLIILRSPSVGRSEWGAPMVLVSSSACPSPTPPPHLTSAAVTSWVPDAQFFFESEETFRDLVLQRRRWLNGTLGGYPWLLARKELWGSVVKTNGARAFQALAMLGLCLIQVRQRPSPYALPTPAAASPLPLPPPPPALRSSSFSSALRCPPSSAASATSRSPPLVSSPRPWASTSQRT